MTIYFGGVEMPAPKLNGGLVETYENVWSADTGRNSAGRMMGTLVATKAKLKFSWNALSWADAAKIRNARRAVGIARTAIFLKIFICLLSPFLIIICGTSRRRRLRRRGISARAE